MQPPILYRVRAPQGYQTLIDHEGYEYGEYDMRGYLDQWDDGESECIACGAPLDSHVIYDEFDPDQAWHGDEVLIIDQRYTLVPVLTPDGY